MYHLGCFIDKALLNGKEISQGYFVALYINNYMSILEKKANEIANEMAKDEKIKSYAIDPFTISIIVSILTELIKLYISCRKSSKEAAETMRNPGLIQRWRLKRLIRNHLDDEEVHHILHKDLFQATLKIANEVTDEEVKEIYEEVK